MVTDDPNTQNMVSTDPTTRNLKLTVAKTKETKQNGMLRSVTVCVGRHLEVLFFVFRDFVS
jgi:sorbitol-specific phosphotransferase system component IIBC